MNIDLSKIRKELVALCEDNEIMQQEINIYFDILERDSYFKIQTKR